MRKKRKRKKSPRPTHTRPRAPVRAHHKTVMALWGHGKLLITRKVFHKVSKMSIQVAPREPESASEYFNGAGSLCLIHCFKTWEASSICISLYSALPALAQIFSRKSTREFTNTVK